MKFAITTLIVMVMTTGCVVVPAIDDAYVNRCEISSDRKILKIVDVAKDTNSYYSISGILLTPIIVPITGIVSGSYVVVNNIYHLGEEKIVCGRRPSET